MKILVEAIKFLLTIPILFIILPIAMASFFFMAIRTLIFGEADNPTGPVRRVLTIATILAIGAFVAHTKYTAEPVEISTWESSQECYSEHLTQSDGGFSLLNDDNICDLIRYCDWAYLTKQHDLSDLVHQISWKWALHGGGMKRSKRLQEYFLPFRSHPFDEYCYDEQKKRHDNFKQQTYADAVNVLRKFHKEQICGIERHKSTTIAYIYISVIFPDYLKDIEASIDKEIMHFGQNNFCATP